MKVFLYLILLLQFANCASVVPYKGPMPDYSLTGEKAAMEVEKFTMKKEWMPFQDSVFYGSIKLGKDNQYYTGDSLKGLIFEVSPQATEKFNESQNWWLASKIAMAVLVAVMLTAKPSKNAREELQQSGIQLGIIGVQIALQTVSISKSSTAADLYNNSLKQKFAPTIGYNYTF